MRRTNLKPLGRLALAIVVAMMCVGGAMASPISGTFNMSGIVTATGSAIDYFTDQTGHTANLFTMSGGTDSFAGINGQEVVANIANETVNTAFPKADFITIAGITPTLQINEIFGGTSPNKTSAACNVPVAVNDTCTPDYLTGALGSPFTFVDNPPGGNLSSATWVVSGVTSDGLSNWDAIFTSQFPSSYQAVLSSFVANGSITNAYSATVFVTAIPEPGTLGFIMIGCGLIGLGMGLRRLRTAK